MLRRRVIPCLLLRGDGLVKTRKFRDAKYLGDPINVMRIFNEKEVPEVIVLDISATVERRGPDLSRVAELATECFMPLCYGGGLSTVEQIGSVLELGVEKVSVNTATFENPGLFTEAAKLFGSQSIVVSIDAKSSWPWGERSYSHCGTRRRKVSPVEHAKRMEDAGAGEIFLTSIEREGGMEGYDLELTRSVATAVEIPVIASGGAGSVDHFGVAIREGMADAIAAGSFFVFEGPHRAVLISYPEEVELRRVLEPTDG